MKNRLYARFPNPLAVSGTSILSRWALSLGHLLLSFNAASYFLGSMPIFAFLPVSALLLMEALRKKKEARPYLNQLFFRTLFHAFLTAGLLLSDGFGLQNEVRQLFVMAYFSIFALSLNDAICVYKGKLGIPFALLIKKRFKKN